MVLGLQETSVLSNYNVLNNKCPPDDGEIWPPPSSALTQRIIYIIIARSHSFRKQDGILNALSGLNFVYTIPVNDKAVGEAGKIILSCNLFWSFPRSIAQLTVKSTCSQSAGPPNKTAPAPTPHTRHSELGRLDASPGDSLAGKLPAVDLPFLQVKTSRLETPRKLLEALTVPCPPAVWTLVGGSRVRPARFPPGSPVSAAGIVGLLASRVPLPCVSSCFQQVDLNQQRSPSGDCARQPP